MDRSLLPEVVQKQDARNPIEQEFVLLNRNIEPQGGYKEITQDQLNWIIV